MQCRLVNPMAIKSELSNPVAIQRFQAEFFRLIDIVFNNTASEYERISVIEINRMKGEFPRFVNLVNEWKPQASNIDENANLYINQMEETCIFWKVVHHHLPSISKFARLAFTFVPSSAAVERVFSMMKALFSKQQMTNILGDYLQCSLMLRYNKDNPRNLRFL